MDPWGKGKPNKKCWKIWCHKYYCITLCQDNMQRKSSRKINIFSPENWNLGKFMMKIQSTDQQVPMVKLPIPSTTAGLWGQKGQESKWQYFWFGELKYFCGQAMDLGTQSIQDPAFRTCRGDRRVKWSQGRGGHKWREGLRTQELLNMSKGFLSLSENQGTRAAKGLSVPTCPCAV